MKQRIYCLFAFTTLFLIIKTSWSKEKDLRPLFQKYNIEVYDQANRGTCSIFAVTGLLEFEYAKAQQEKVKRLSVEYLNWASNQIANEAEDGSYFSDALSALNKYGICENDLFPYYPQKFYDKADPSSSAIEEARKRMDIKAVWIKDWDPTNGMTEEQIEQVKNQISDEHPVAIGFQWPKKDEKYRKMVNGMMYVPPKEGVFDGHSIILVGYKDDPDTPGGGYFIFKNSHGIEYGENGYGKMPYEYVQKYANDGIAIYINE